LQHAQHVHSLLERGTFGISEEQRQDFFDTYRSLFPIAVEFQIPAPPATEAEVAAAAAAAALDEASQNDDTKTTTTA